ncbi:MAG: transcription antitermination factor NusB [Planctomycetota bacterium]
MSTRRRAREVVLQVLFQKDLNPDMDIDTEFEFLTGRLNQHQPTIQFAERLLTGVRQKMQDIDTALKNVTQNWRLERMAATDRSILRLAAFEVLFLESTPGRVAINEAIELAKRYGTNQSFQFVNGILDRLLGDLE